MINYEYVILPHDHIYGNLREFGEKIARPQNNFACIANCAYLLDLYDTVTRIHAAIAATELEPAVDPNNPLYHRNTDKGPSIFHNRRRSIQFLTTARTTFSNLGYNPQSLSLCSLEAQPSAQKNLHPLGMIMHQ